MRKGEKLCKELGIHPKTRKLVNVFESKSGRYLKKGFKRLGIPDNIKTDDITMELAVELLK
jgi:topoisomerase IA-like protein